MSKVWRRVFKNERYVILAFLVALFFYSFNVVISNWNSLISLYSSLGFFGSLKFFLVLLIGFKETVKLHSFISLIIISSLFGLLFSLIVYKTTRVKKSTGKTGLLASVGIFLGALAPGCAACGMGLLSIFGLSAAFLTFLPFEGLELSILSIGILFFTIFKVSEKIHRGNICEINITQMKGGKKYGRKIKN